MHKILSGKRLATPDCFTPYLVTVERKEYSSICLETAFISEELYMKRTRVDKANIWPQNFGKFETLLLS